MNKYLQLKKEIEKEITNFKSFFAFNEEQLNEGLKKLNCDKNDLCSCGMGEFINRKDKEKYVKMWLNINKKEKDFLQDEENLFNALCYELNNHEFGYTYELEPTLNCLNLTYETLTDKQKEILERAKHKVLNEREY